ncbi:MAG: hypothetical protein V3U33_00335 [candidate division NC10 bacterium]
MPARVALEAAKEASQAVLGDLVVIEGKVFREVKEGRKKRLEPVNVRVSINPLTAAVGLGAGLLGGAVGLWALGLGVDILAPDERQQLEMQIAANEQGIKNLQDSLAAKEAADACIFEEIVGGIFIRTDACADLRASIKVLEVEGNRLRARLRIPFRIVQRPRFTGFPSFFP